MKTSILLSLIFVCFLIESTDEVQFNISIEPNTEYRKHTSTTISTELDFTGNTESMEKFQEKLKQQGIQLPIKSKQQQQYVHITQTGPLKKDSSFSFTMQFDNVQMMTERNGQTYPSHNPVINKNTVFSGMFTSEGEMKLNNIEGADIPTGQKKTIKNMITQTQERIEFPDEPISEGDEFNQTVPLSFPVPNVGTLNFDMVINYMLTKLTKKKAYFDLTTEFKLQPGLEAGANIEATGFGGGKMVHDLSYQYPVNYRTNYTLNLKYTSGQSKVIASIKSKSTNMTEIAENKE